MEGKRGRNEEDVVLDILSSLRKPLLMSVILRKGNVTTQRGKQLLLPLIERGLVKQSGKRYIRTPKGDIYYYKRRKF